MYRSHFAEDFSVTVYCPHVLPVAKAFSQDTAKGTRELKTAAHSLPCSNIVTRTNMLPTRNLRHLEICRKMIASMQRLDPICFLILEDQMQQHGKNITSSLESSAHWKQQKQLGLDLHPHRKTIELLLISRPYDEGRWDEGRWRK